MTCVRNCLEETELKDLKPDLIMRYLKKTGRMDLPRVSSFVGNAPFSGSMGTPLRYGVKALSL